MPPSDCAAGNRAQPATVLASGTPHRLLIAIDASTEASWGLDYALLCQRSAIPLDVVLLYVAPTPDSTALRGFISEQEMRIFLEERGTALLSTAAATLVRHGIPCRTRLLHGDPICETARLAHELECAEIVLPNRRMFNATGWFFLARLQKRCHPIHIRLVDQGGFPTPV